MRIDFNISQAEAKKFYMACEAVIRNVGAGTQAATAEAAYSIMEESWQQVPIDTGALIASYYIGISERSDVVSYNYGAVLGYGAPTGLADKLNIGSQTKTITDPGAGYTQYGVYHQTVGPSRVRIRVAAPITWIQAPTNRINIKTGLPASAYAGRVHEDLDMPHPNGGKAKFLEDPVRNWAAGKFARTAMTYWKTAIHTTRGSSAMLYYNRATRMRKPVFTGIRPVINSYTLEKQYSKTQRGGKTVHKGDDL